jgi:hypothetical protein
LCSLALERGCIVGTWEAQLTVLAQQYDRGVITLEEFHGQLFLLAYEAKVKNEERQHLASLAF